MGDRTAPKKIASRGGRKCIMSGELETIRDWYAYNSNVRRRYLDSFAKLPKEELSRDRGASYPSILDIFEHVLGAYLYWITGASTGNSALPQVKPPPEGNDSTPTTLELVSKEERQVQSMIKEFLNGLTEEDLDKTFLQRERKVSVRAMLWHLVEEELQHRGELNALLWQIDVDPHILSWIDWIEQATLN
ncbi:MAG: DinB family protein [Thaumarchaeota archaeon]|nr:DinB family protein [Nitrososphaerota archaeon]